MGEEASRMNMKGGLANKFNDDEAFEEDDDFDDDFELIDVRGRRKAMQNMEERQIEFPKPLY